MAVYVLLYGCQAPGRYTNTIVKENIMHTSLAKRILCAVLLVVLVTVLVGCGPRYKEEKVIGLSAKEIIEKYGEFEIGAEPDGDGMYRNSNAGYIVRNSPPRWFMIYFDEDGIAYRGVYEQVGGD